MRGAVILLPLLLLAVACGKREADAPEASVQRGLDRSVADVRAAEAAAAGPIDPALSASELSAKAETSSVPAKAKG